MSSHPSTYPSATNVGQFAAKFHASQLSPDTEKTDSAIMLKATPFLRAAGGMPGFWTRSLEEFRRQATIAVRMEGISSPDKPRHLIKFDREDVIPQCKVMTDKSSFGGYSEASLTFVPAVGSTAEGAAEGGEDRGEPAHALFKGNIDTTLPPNKPEVQRSGFAAWRTRDRGMSLFGKLLYDIDPYSFLALRIKSDGRKYFVNIQTESIVPTDLHQHLLPCFQPGQWETVIIPFHAFVRTNHGMVVEPQSEMLRQKVRSIGIGLTDRVPGPFELRIAELYATNSAPRRTVANGFGVMEEDEEDREVEKKRKAEEPEKIMI